MATAFIAGGFLQKAFPNSSQFSPSVHICLRSGPVLSIFECACGSPGDTVKKKIQAQDVQIGPRVGITRKQLGAAP